MVASRIAPMILTVEFAIIVSVPTTKDGLIDRSTELLEEWKIICSVSNGDFNTVLNITFRCTNIVLLPDAMVVDTTSVTCTHSPIGSRVVKS